MSEAFITGSRAYGDPRLDSDVDLVIRCSPDLEATLRYLSDFKDPTERSNPTRPIRFGRLNLITCTTDEQFAVWRLGTTHMKNVSSRQLVTFPKEDAKQVFDRLREMVEILDSAQSGKKDE